MRVHSAASRRARGALAGEPGGPSSIFDDEQASDRAYVTEATARTRAPGPGV